MGDEGIELCPRRSAGLFQAGAMLAKLIEVDLFHECGFYEPGLFPFHATKTRPLAERKLHLVLVQHLN